MKKYHLIFRENWFDNGEYLNNELQHCHLFSGYRLGEIFLKGDGVEVDKNKAQFYFEKAAYNGHVGSQFELAILYFSKQGDKDSPAHARGSYRYNFIQS